MSQCAYLHIGSFCINLLYQSLRFQLRITKKSVLSDKPNSADKAD